MKRSLFALACWLLAPAAFAILDTNNNGVSDLWERDFNNGSLFDEFFNPQADPDKDGWTNEQEAAAGTNPLDPNPPEGTIRPEIIHTPAVWGEENGVPYIDSPEAVTVTWPTIPGKRYRLLVSPDLSQGSWIEVPDSDFIGNGNIPEFHFTTDESDKLFWRVAVCDVDSDNDGLTDHEEFLSGTNPANADSDGDGMSDLYESIHNFNPNDSGDASADSDGDGLSNLQELILGTDPNSPDDHSDVGDEAVVNGSFSEPAIFVPGPDGRGTTGLEATKGETGWNYWAGIPGWKAVQGENVELQTFATGPEDPNVELKAQPEGHRGIQQWIKTRVGVSYLVMFKAMPRPYIGDGSLNNFEVYADETRIKEIIYTGEVDPETVAWETHTAVFTAQQVLTKLSFIVPESNPDNTLGCIVDEIILLPVKIVPDEDQSGKTGDLIPSNKGATGEKHYVSPKKTTEIPDDFVVLKATGVGEDRFVELFEWEGGEAHPTNPVKRRVKRDAAAKTVVKIKVKQGGAEIAKMNVWVVWATMNGRIQGAGFSANNDLSIDDYEMTQLGSHEVTFTRLFPNLDGTTDKNHHHLFISGIEWRADLEPDAMFQLDDDIPDLTKVTQKDQNPPLTFDGGRAYYTHWDVSRDRKLTRKLDGVIDVEELNWVIDDDTNYTRDEDPYEQATEKEESGEIFSVDSPGADTIKKEDFGQPLVFIPDCNSFEVKHVFKEWARVRLSGKWFDISDKADWYSNVKINKASGEWSAETHDIGLGVQE